MLTKYILAALSIAFLTLAVIRMVARPEVDSTVCLLLDDRHARIAAVVVTGQCGPPVAHALTELFEEMVLGAEPAIGAVVLVDTHFHATPVWYDRVESALLHMNEQGVRYGCMVQIGGYFNHDYQEDVMRRYPGRFINIVQVDWTKPDAIATRSSGVAILDSYAMNAVRLASPYPPLPARLGESLRISANFNYILDHGFRVFGLQ